MNKGGYLMNIVVCVKRVPHPDIVRFNIETGLLEDIYYVLNHCDKVALEEAIRIKENLGEVEVTAITLDTPEAEEILRYCLAMGADKAVLLWDDSFKNLDAYATSIVLAKAISKLPYDMILCGRISTDDLSGFVGTCISEFLNLPLVSDITKMEVSEDRKRVIVHRHVRKIDREVTECPLPAVFTVDEELNEPRYVSSAKILRAREKEVIRLDVKSLGIEHGSIEMATKILSYSQPKPRLKKSSAIESLSPMERLKMITAGGASKKTSTKLVQKPPEIAASEIMRFLTDIGILSSE
jgi:electron transfer flavoprotein beta subunit